MKKGKKEKHTSKVDGREYWYRKAICHIQPSYIFLQELLSQMRAKAARPAPKGKLRRLVRVELERLNIMFPDNHTEGITDMRRAFCMGNALVVGVIQRIGKTLSHVAEQPACHPGLEIIFKAPA